MRLRGYVSIFILLLLILLPRPFSAELQSVCVTETQQTISFYLFVALKTGLSLPARWLGLFIRLLLLSVLHVVVCPCAEETSRFLHNTLPYLHNMTNTPDESGLIHLRLSIVRLFFFTISSQWKKVWRLPTLQTQSVAPRWKCEESSL